MILLHKFTPTTLELPALLFPPLPPQHHNSLISILKLISTDCKQLLMILVTHIRLAYLWFCTLASMHSIAYHMHTYIVIQTHAQTYAQTHAHTHTRACSQQPLRLTLSVAGVFSLALLPSRPSCTNSSSSRTSNSCISLSPSTFAAMLANALITARDTCLQKTLTHYTGTFIPRWHLSF